MPEQAARPGAPPRAGSTSPPCWRALSRSRHGVPMRHKAWRVCGLSLLALANGRCTLLTASPPQVQVQSVQLQGLSLLDQSLAVTLCVWM